MRAVAAAAAAAAGAVTAGGGRPRRRAQSLVWPAGSCWPDSCARSRVAPVLSGFHRAEATPPIVWLLNWQTLGSPRGGEPRGGGRSARLRPDSLSIPQCQSPRRCSRPSTRSGGLGTAPERPDGVDGTPQRCQGRSESMGQRREEWPSGRRVCAAATKWLERWGEELGGGGQRGPTLPRLGRERTPRTRRKIPPDPRRPRAEICWGMAPSADSPGRPRETQRRKVKTMKRLFSPICVLGETWILESTYLADHLALTYELPCVRTTQEDTNFLFVESCCCCFFNVKLNSILPHPPQKASAPYSRQMSHSYQASVPYINTNSFFLGRPQMHMRPQSITAPGKQSMLKVMLEWNQWTYMFEAPHHPLHDLGVSFHPWTQTRGDCFCLLACLFTRYHHPFFWLTVPSFFLGDHPATLRAVWMGKSIRMVQLFRIQEWAPELS